MFDQLKKLQELRKQAIDMKKELAAEIVEIEHRGIKIKIRGDQQVESVIVEGIQRPDLTEAINKAVRESQKAAALKMSGRMGNFGFPGI